MSDAEDSGVAAKLFGGWTALRGVRDDASDWIADLNLASHVQILERRGIWPGCATIGDPSSGKPFVSEIGDYRSLHFDWGCVQSGMSVANPLKLTLDYTKAMMGFLFFNPAPRFIEMIGLGGGSLAKFCHHVLPSADITVVELDAEVIAMRNHFSVPAESERFRIVCGDGAAYVRTSLIRPDVLLVDGFDARGQPPQLCSPEFYAQCFERLAPNGLLVVNLWGDDPGHFRHAALIKHIFSGKLVLVPSIGSANQTVIARKGSDLSLTKTQMNQVTILFKQSCARFLPAIGKRIFRQLEIASKH
ncbi:Spermidine synthase-like protein [Sphingobium indicum BiD32]|uniref:Spermidine synthase-like protein n=1 Tax=Sphingobium indicum BiD32 TaxID=1301087 RepID=N1MM04_9SPHN|nr:spermidine synthase-like protein [Sphingobium indicum]CCW18011.1 Spermidine synthase-like protein [Sphingobium indicum BiD32]